ncbi:glycosyltransferase [Lithospermum erythrorhizon]|uniref:Dolichyl-diphosphooligosaccharide--protein glycosyltransferase subunit 2 n=1 Tax=Lithospermum erythrorhizon TaxID=34254 RepID=A0AAV3PQX4_LITER
MDINYGVIVLFVMLIGSICDASIFQPISDTHRSVALELFTPSDGSFSSVEEAYEALKTFEVLGIKKKSNVKDSTCKSVVEVLWSPDSGLKALFDALRVNEILECELSNEAFTGIASRLKDAIGSASSLHDFYYAVGGLRVIKDQISDVDVQLGDADKVFRSVKALSQSDGRWRYNFNNPESSAFAAGMAFETLAGIISLASTDIDQSLIDAVKKDILKLFDGAEKYDDGAYYFDEKLVDGQEYQGPVSASSSVVLGVTAYAAATSESLNLPGEKIHGLAKFLLAVETPGNGKNLYHQIVALVSLENNRQISIKFFTPLILSLPASVLSLTSKDQLKVKVSTVLGSSAPPLSVKLMQIFSSESQDSAVMNQDLKFDSKGGLYYMDALPESIDVGRYIFSFEVVLHDPDNKKVFVTGGRARVAVYVTGVIKINHAELSIRDSDVGSVESLKKLDLNGKNEIALSANHLQKLKISFQLNTPLGHAFKPHQAFLKLRHESKVEHIFVVGTTGKNFEIILDFLGLVDKFYYLSGKYELQLSIGDTAMENSFSQHLGHVDLDLPVPPEKATRPPAQPTGLYSRYGPKAEITHIFRAPEKRPLRELSLAFLGLVLLPFIGFLIMLLRLGVNLKNFPTTAVSSVFALLFHVGIGAVLLLYSLFWLKLNLFTTLKALGFLGVFLMFVGHRTLSHLASASAKLKSA